MQEVIIGALLIVVSNIYFLYLGRLHRNNSFKLDIMLDILIFGYYIFGTIAGGVLIINGLHSL